MGLSEREGTGRVRWSCEWGRLSSAHHNASHPITPPPHHPTTPPPHHPTTPPPHHPTTRPPHHPTVPEIDGPFLRPPATAAPRGSGDLEPYASERAGRSTVSEQSTAPGGSTSVQQPFLQFGPVVVVVVVVVVGIGIRVDVWCPRGSKEREPQVSAWPTTTTFHDLPSPPSHHFTYLPTTLQPEGAGGQGQWRAEPKQRPTLWWEIREGRRTRGARRRKRPDRRCHARVTRRLWWIAPWQQGLGCTYMSKTRCVRVCVRVYPTSSLCALLTLSPRRPHTHSRTNSLTRSPAHPLTHTHHALYN